MVFVSAQRSLLAIVILGSVGCSGQEMRAVSSGSNGSNGADTTVLLVTDPATCFSCSIPFMQWIAAGRKHDVRFAWSRKPSRGEAAAIRLLRITEAAVPTSRRDEPGIALLLLQVGPSIADSEWVLPSTQESRILRTIGWEQ